MSWYWMAAALIAGTGITLIILETNEWHRHTQQSDWHRQRDALKRAVQRNHGK